MSDWEVQMAALRAEADLAIRESDELYGAAAEKAEVTIRAVDLLRLLDACQSNG